MSTEPLADLLHGNVIHTYTQADAVADGTLVAVDSATAKEAGFAVPVLLTAEAWADSVSWDDSVDARKGGFTGQAVAGRLWDVLYMTRLSALSAGAASRVTVSLYRVPGSGRGLLPREVTLVAHIGPADDGSTCIVIMMPDQD